jgi:hypothetical protein
MWVACLDQYEFRRARITNIKWDNTLAPIATPERPATPNYYGDAHYLAWFRLERIDDRVLPESELQNWSYVKVDEFFETKKSAFEEFYDKQLASFKELRNQDRTIWFIRPKKSTDGVHEIHVHDRTRTSPSNFSEILALRREQGTAPVAKSTMRLAHDLSRGSASGASFCVAPRFEPHLATFAREPFLSVCLIAEASNMFLLAARIGDHNMPLRADF